MLQQHRHFHHKPGLSPSRHLVNTKNQAAGPAGICGPGNRTVAADASSITEFVLIALREIHSVPAMAISVL